MALSSRCLNIRPAPLIRLTLILRHIRRRPLDQASGDQDNDASLAVWPLRSKGFHVIPSSLAQDYFFTPGFGKAAFTLSQAGFKVADRREKLRNWIDCPAAVKPGAVFAVAKRGSLPQAIRSSTWPTMVSPTISRWTLCQVPGSNFAGNTPKVIALSGPA